MQTRECSHGVEVGYEKRPRFLSEALTEVDEDTVPQSPLLKPCEDPSKIPDFALDEAFPFFPESVLSEEEALSALQADSTQHETASDTTSQDL